MLSIYSVTVLVNCVYVPISVHMLNLNQRQWFLGEILSAIYAECKVKQLQCLFMILSSSYYHAIAWREWFLVYGHDSWMAWRPHRVSRIAYMYSSQARPESIISLDRLIFIMFNLIRNISRFVFGRYGNEGYSMAVCTVVYMLQSIVGTRHYRECLKFSGNTGSACDHQSLPVLPKIFSHYRECLKLRASFSQDCPKCFYSPNP